MASEHTDRAGRGEVTRSVAIAVLVVLTIINFLNYLDRYVLSAVLEDVRTEFVLDDARAGLLGTAFMVVYTVFAPLGGVLGDRWNRQRITAIAVALWSAATIAGGFARDYEQLLVTRALVGIGEAGYITVAPSVIADLFRPHERGRKLAIFYLAIPMGSALGYLLGGWVGQHYGWRAAFMVAGVPGFVFAIAAACLPEPVRGATDAEAPLGRVGFGDALGQLFRNQSWRTNTIGMTFSTFALGGMAFWMPSYLVRAQGFDLATANTAFGGLTVVAGLLATLVGGHLGDRAEARRPGGYFRVAGIGLLLGAPVVLVMPMLPTPTLVLAAAFVAEFFLFLNTGPLNAALVGCVPAELRARAFATNVFFIHAFGDAISPTLMGLVSDARGGGATGIATAVSATAIPLALAAFVLLEGARRAPSAGLRRETSRRGSA